MKPRLTNTILIVLLLLNVAFIGTWWMHHMKTRDHDHMMGDHRGQKGDKGMMFLSKELDFDSIQREKAAKLFEAHAGTMKKYQEEISRLQKQIYNCMVQDAPDSVHAFMYADSVGMCRVAMQKEFFRNATAIRQICTPDQKKKYDELMQRMTKGLGHHWD